MGALGVYQHSNARCSVPLALKLKDWSYTSAKSKRLGKCFWSSGRWMAMFMSGNGLGKRWVVQLGGVKFFRFFIENSCA